MFDSIAKIISFLDRRSRWQLAGLTLLAVIVSGLEVFGIGLIFGFVKLLIDPALIETIPRLQQVYKLLGSGNPKNFLILGAVALMILFLLKNLIMAGFVYLQIGFVQAEAKQTSIRMLRRLYYGYGSHFPSQ